MQVFTTEYQQVKYKNHHSFTAVLI